jgi:hypothetical protein
MEHHRTHPFWWWGDGRQHGHHRARVSIPRPRLSIYGPRRVSEETAAGHAPFPPADMGTLGGFPTPPAMVRRRRTPAGFPRDRARVFKRQGRMTCPAEFAGLSARIDARHAAHNAQGSHRGRIGLWLWSAR